MTQTPENLYADEYFEYLRNRNLLRRLVRKFYLNDIRSFCVGKTIDFGCGIGELLTILPGGSIGFEINQVAVKFCKSKGLNVEEYNPDEDNYRFTMIDPGEYSTFTMNHVLEHIENSHEVIMKIFTSCNRLGIKRIVFTVPGYRGYKSDKTHRTFIDKKYFANQGLLNDAHYVLKKAKYFPVNNAKFGHYFMHNELKLVFDKRNG
jgi:2-polyprenyl-3-methyl-5-hydroxy-6-metoxy-1,4-benzoquinol methylase